MEDFPAINAGSNIEQPETGKKRRRVFGERGWLNDLLKRRAEANPEVESDEDDEEKETPVSIKGRGVLSRFFRSIVKREQVEQPKAGKFSDQASTHETHEAEQPSQPTDSQERSPEYIFTSQPKVEGTPSYLTEQQTETSPSYPRQEQPERPNNEPKVESGVGITGVSEQISEPEQQSGISEALPVAEQSQPQVERVVYERERVIEHAPSALGPLLALEHFGRKRADKMITKDVNQLEKRIDKHDSDRLEQLTHRSREQAAILHERRRLYDQPAPAERMPLQTVPAEAGTTEVTKTVERVKITQPSSAEAITRPEKEILKEIHYTTPEQVLKEVAAAADKDAAIEKVYERRGEIKDEPTTGHGSGAGAAASIATVLQSSQERLTAAERKQLARTIEKAHKHHEKAEQSMYKQAVISGFTTGAIILAALLAASIVR